MLISVTLCQSATSTFQLIMGSASSTSHKPPTATGPSESMLAMAKLSQKLELEERRIATFRDPVPVRDPVLARDPVPACDPVPAPDHFSPHENAGVVICYLASSDSKKSAGITTYSSKGRPINPNRKMIALESLLPKPTSK